MPQNTPIFFLFLLGLAVGTGLLVVGLLLGYWFGRRASPAGDLVNRSQFLQMLKDLSSWTSEFSGDVSKYQSQLTSLSREAESKSALPKERVLAWISEVMETNKRLQERLDHAEEKLQQQTDQISSYLTEARTDGLTGLLNRRAFDKATRELFASWQGTGQVFALGLVDIDHFKQINDTYGHLAGDAVLQHISDTLQTELDDTVCIARYGGEEFAVLSTARVGDAAAVLERLRDEVSKIEIVHEDRVIRLTLSAGVAEIQAEDRIANLVSRADEALYSAKLGGRNRVYLHDGTLCHLVTRVEPGDQVAADGADTSDPLVAQAEAAEAISAQTRLQERLQRIVEEESRRVVGR